MNEILDAALAYARRGWRVIPLHEPADDGTCSCGREKCDRPAKHPRTPNGLDDGTTDEEAIRGWWERWPRANVAIVAGGGSRLVVVDVDPRHGGDFSLAELETRCGALPETVTQHTGGGGRHHLFAHPGGHVAPRVGLLPGIDIRGDGSYAVAPPSVHVSGREYTWEFDAGPDDIEPAPLPVALLELIRVGKNGSNGRAPHVEEGQTFEEGGRNDWLASMAGTMQRRGFTLEAVTAALLEENALRCRPPLEEDEVRRVAESIGQYPPAGDGADAGPPPDDLLAALRALPDDPDAKDVDKALRAFREAVATADPIRRAVAREGAVEVLKERGIRRPAALIDAALAGLKEAGPAEGAGKAPRIEDPEPWPEPVAGAELLGDLRGTLERYLILPEHGAVALALWTLGTFVLDAVDVFPRLLLTSPEKRCGKTRAISLLAMAARRPLTAASITSAALFRGIERWGPTIVLDEADTFLKDNEELRGVLNSGHSRTAAFVVRVAGDDLEPRLFSTFGAMVVAMIGRPAGTITDRSVILVMKRRAPGEKIERLRRRLVEAALAAWRRKALRWATDNLPAIRLAEPEVPAGLDDRAADNWSALLAVADLAGGEWPDLAWAAAVALSRERADDGASYGVLLLADIRAIFRREKTDRLATKALIRFLLVLPERPWPEVNRGKPLTDRRLASLLQPFGVKSKNVRLDDGKVPKGYAAESFEDAWSRYLGPEDATALQGYEDRGFGDFGSATEDDAVADPEMQKPYENRGRSAVADPEGEMREPGEDDGEEGAP